VWYVQCDGQSLMLCLCVWVSRVPCVCPETFAAIGDSTKITRICPARLAGPKMCDDDTLAIFNARGSPSPVAAGFSLVA